MTGGTLLAVRRGASILIAAALLVLPGTALARQTSVVGTVTGDTAGLPFSFGAFGKKVVKGKLVAKKVNSFTATADIHCFDAAGNQISSTEYNNLPVSALGTLRLSKRQNFDGFARAGGWDITVSGVLRNGKAHGLFAVAQGTKGSAGYCSTGTFANAAVQWTARQVRLVCTGADLAARPLCTTPRS